MSDLLNDMQSELPSVSCSEGDGLRFLHLGDTPWVQGAMAIRHPEVIVLGGRLAEVGEILSTPMRVAIERSAIPSASASLVVRRSELEADADVVGAIVAAEALHASNESSLITIASTS